MDHISNRNAYRPPCPALFLQYLRTTVPGPLEDAVLKTGRTLGQPGQQETVDSGRRPNRQHRIAMLSENQGFDLTWRQIEFLGNQ